MLIENNKTRYSTKLKINPAFIEKISKNNILKEYKNIKSRNDSNSIRFKTIIFQKTNNEKQKENNSNYNSNIFQTHQMACPSSTNDELNKDKQQNKFNNILNLTPLKTKKKLEFIEKDEKKNDFENFNRNNNKLKLKRKKKNHSESVNINYIHGNEHSGNILNIKYKNFTPSNLMVDHNSVKVLPNKHKKSFSAVITQIDSLITNKEGIKLKKGLPNLNQPNKKNFHNLNKTSQTIIKHNVLDLKRQLYNKYFSISQIIKEKRISAEKEKAQLKLNIVNYSDNISDMTNLYKKKFLSTYYVKSLVENAQKNFPSRIVKINK